MTGALSAAAEHLCSGGWQAMPSGVGHDARHRPADAGHLLFVPSVGGISHHWAEDTGEADLGVRVLGEAAATILAG